MPISIHGKRIIVTGGASGIAAAAVKALAREGADIVSFDVTEAEGRKIAEQASSEGPGKVDFRRVDVRRRQEVEQAVSAAVTKLGGLDAVLNIAGVERTGLIGALADEDIELMFDVNVKGLMAICAASFPHLKEQGGSIVNFGSDAGLGASTGHAYYGASKGAVHAFTRQAAAEYGRHNVRVNTVIPAIWTPMYDAYRARMSDQERMIHDMAMQHVIPLGGKLGDPDRDAAPVMVFLASDLSRFITGQAIPVDGGMVMLG